MNAYYEQRERQVRNKEWGVWNYHKNWLTAGSAGVKGGRTQWRSKILGEVIRSTLLGGVMSATHSLSPWGYGLCRGPSSPKMSGLYFIYMWTCLLSPFLCKFWPTSLKSCSLLFLTTSFSVPPAKTRWNTSQAQHWGFWVRSENQHAHSTSQNRIADGDMFLTCPPQQSIFTSAEKFTLR